MSGVVVGYLSGGDTRIEFTQSLGAMTAYSIQKGVPLVGALPHVSGPRIAAGRNHMVEAFLNTPADWLFMVDDDMTFDRDVLERFLKVADPDTRPIVGGLAFATGRDGIFPTLFKLDPTINGPTRFDAWPLDELVEVDGTGAACLFIHRSVFEKMAEVHPKPWQWFQETTLGEQSVGEDMTFCLRARALGIPIFVDTSIKFGHVKPRIINEDEYFRWVDTHRIVVTGTGKCGLYRVGSALWAARLRVGVHQMFTVEGRKPNPFLRGDVSWCAPPFLDRFVGLVLQVVRHPVPTVLSLAKVEIDEATRGFVETHAPQILDFDTPIERAMAWYLAWNRMINDHAHDRIRVEELSGDGLINTVRYAGGLHAPWELQTAVNALRPWEPDNQDWGLLPDGDLKDELRIMAKDFGYE